MWVCFSCLFIHEYLLLQSSAIAVCFYGCMRPVLCLNFYVCAACHSICSYEHVLYGHRMEATHFTNVCGSPVFWEFCVWCGCRRKAALFLRLCVSERVCVWCGQRLKRASVHMGTNDRIWFSEPICKKDERNQTSKNYGRGLARPPTEISLQRQMVSWWSPFFTLHLVNSNEPPQQFECHHCFKIRDIKELITNQIWDWYQTILGELWNKQKQPNYPHSPLLLPKS